MASQIRGPPLQCIVGSSTRCSSHDLRRGRPRRSGERADLRRSGSSWVIAYINILVKAININGL